MISSPVETGGRQDMERPVYGEDVRVHDLVVEQDAVERVGHDAIDIICTHSQPVNTPFFGSQQQKRTYI